VDDVGNTKVLNRLLQSVEVGDIAANERDLLGFFRGSDQAKAPIVVRNVERDNRHPIADERSDRRSADTAQCSRH
jgi:hypothetical protein